MWWQFNRSRWPFNYESIYNLICLSVCATFEIHFLKVQHPIRAQKIDRIKLSSPVPNPSPKSKSQMLKCLNAKGTGADTIILQATHHPNPPITFLTWNVNPVMGKDHPWPSLTLLDLPWPSMTFHDLLWPSMTFYHLLRPLWRSMIKCLLSRPLIALIAGPLHSTPLQINSKSIPRLDHIDSKSS